MRQESKRQEVRRQESRRQESKRQESKRQVAERRVPIFARRFLAHVDDYETHCGTTMAAILPTPGGHDTRLASESFRC